MKKDAKNATVADTRNASWLVKRMTIYTRTGDKGETSLYGGKRVLKSALQVETYGSIDELTSFLGLVIVKLKNLDDKTFFTLIQKDLYKIMACISGSKSELEYLNTKIKNFEKTIDNIQSKLPELSHFIIPGGTEISSWFHILRTITRRSERLIVNFSLLDKTIKKINKELVIKYLNRLSDLFFIFARKYNKEKETLA